jgi:deoxyribonuclease V
MDFTSGGTGGRTMAAEQTDARALYAWGRARFESQAAPVRWAGTVLRAASRHLPDFPEVEEALLLAETEERWPQAREVFDRVRWRSLSQEAPLDEPQALLFRLAELVAKAAHNAAGVQPPFDHDAGWLIGPVADRLRAATDDPRLHAGLAAALGGRPPRTR